MANRQCRASTEANASWRVLGVPPEGRITEMKENASVSLWVDRKLRADAGDVAGKCESASVEYCTERIAEVDDSLWNGEKCVGES